MHLGLTFSTTAEPPAPTPALRPAEGTSPATAPHPTAARRPRVVVLGGGFAGIQAVRGLRRCAVDVVLVDRRNFTLFQPLLYQVATGLLSPANIASPLRGLFARQANATVVLDDAVAFDPRGKRVQLAGGVLAYDYLVVACGSRHHYFGKPEWEFHAPGLKSLEDAEDIRRRIFTAFERAERAVDDAERKRLLTFVVVGGGPTSVELAGAVAEIARHGATTGFRALAAHPHRVVLVEADARVLGSFSPESSAEALRALASLGVEARLGSRVVDVSPAGVRVTGPAGETLVEAATVLWGAGVRASPLGARLAEAAGVATGPGGRLTVAADCSLPSHPDVFVVGDMAHFVQDGKALPGVAPVALQQGDFVAETIRARLAGRPAPVFRYIDRGSMATIGKRLAVVDIGTVRLRGRIAWLAWLALHLMKIVRFENRVLVSIQWLWSYATWNRNASLVTGDDPDRPPPT